MTYIGIVPPRRLVCWVSPVPIVYVSTEDRDSMIDPSPCCVMRENFLYTCVHFGVAETRA